MRDRIPRRFSTVSSTKHSVTYASTLNRTQLVTTAEKAIRDGARLDAVASAVGADRRRLVPAFREEVGLAPKQYQRILRFQRALRAMRSPTPAPLAAIPARCGYADQAHMSRDFKEFSGLTPGRVHGATSTAFNHVPIVAHEGE